MNFRSTQRNSWPRFFAFFIIPLIVLSLANTYLVQSDTPVALMFDELKARDDIDIVFVGPSGVCNSVNPAAITEATGLKAFNLTLGNMGGASAYAAAKLMYKQTKNRPKYVVLIPDSDMLLEPAEDFCAQPRLTPEIRNPFERLRYHLELAAADGQFIDRFLAFHALPARSLADIQKTLNIPNDPERYRKQITVDDPTSVYMGAGHMRVSLGVREGMIFEQMAYTQLDRPPLKALPDRTERQFLRLKALCEKNGAQLLVLLAPMPTVFKLANACDRTAYQAASDFFAENGVPCYNLSLARPEYQPKLDGYYFDLAHLNGTGSDLYSAYLSGLLSRILAGESVDHEFYASWDEFRHAVDTVANVYMFPAEAADGRFAVTAGSNRGLDVVPLYRFSVQDADGKETVLRDYAPDEAFSCDRSLVSGKTLIVSAKSETQETPVRYLMDI